MADHNDNSVGIVAIIVIIILAGIGLYYFFGAPRTSTLPVENSTVNIEAPSTTTPASPGNTVIKPQPDNTGTTTGAPKPESTPTTPNKTNGAQ